MKKKSYSIESITAGKNRKRFEIIKTVESAKNLTFLRYSIDLCVIIVLLVIWIAWRMEIIPHINALARFSPKIRKKWYNCRSGSENHIHWPAPCIFNIIKMKHTHAHQSGMTELLPHIRQRLAITSKWHCPFCGRWIISISTEIYELCRAHIYIGMPWPIE